MNLNKIILTVSLALIIFLALGQSEPQKDPFPTKTGYIQVDGGKFYYEEAGEGSVIVLIHDGLVHREIWDHQFKAFSKEYRVIRYDRRGYGKSPHPEKAYSIIEDLHQLFLQRKIEKAVIMGMSMGGKLAVDFTLAHPEKVSGLVLVGAVVSGFDYTEHFMTRGGHLTPEFRSDPKAFQEYWLTNDPYEVSPANTAVKARLKTLIEANLQNYDMRKHQLNRPPARQALPNLKEIQVPALIIVGEDDIPDVHAHAGALSAGIPNARRVVIKQAGHLVPMEQPDSFNRHALDFLRKVK